MNTENYLNIPKQENKANTMNQPLRNPLAVISNNSANERRSNVSNLKTYESDISNNISHRTIQKNKENSSNKLLAHKSSFNKFSNYSHCIDDIIFNMKLSQDHFSPIHNYLLKQTQMNENMRSILVEWMIEVSDEYRLDGQTVHIAVNLVDRMSSLLMIPKDQLQLIGAASIYIASKQVEIFPPEAKDFSFITDDTYTTLEIVSTEKLILQSTGYRIICPTILDFIDCVLFKIFISKQLPESTYSELSCFAMYLADLCLINYHTIVQYKYSILAMSLLMVCTDLLKINHPTIVQYIHSIDCEYIENTISCQHAIYLYFKNIVDHSLYSSVTNKHCALRFHQLVLNRNKYK